MSQGKSRLTLDLGLWTSTLRPAQSLIAPIFHLQKSFHIATHTGGDTSLDLCESVCRRKPKVLKAAARIERRLQKGTLQSEARAAVTET